MPQLDFFTFPHQYVVASICFCGMYYFNLLFLFPKIKYFQLTKIFSLNALAANISVVEGIYLNIFSELLLEENIIYSIYQKWTKKLNWKILFIRLSTLNYKVVNNSQNLIGLLLLSFFLVFFFFKNFLIFNAEKLMLVYFLLVVTLLVFFLKNFIYSLLDNDLKKLLFIVHNIEYEGEQILIFLKNFFFKLRINLVTSYIDFLTLKNFELKFIKK